MTYEKWANLFYHTNLKKTGQLEKRKLEIAFSHQKVTESEMLRYVMVVLVVTRGRLADVKEIFEWAASVMISGSRLWHTLDKAVLMMMGSGGGDYDGDGDGEDEIDDHGDGDDGALQS